MIKNLHRKYKNNLASVVNFIRKRLRQIQGLVVHSYQLLLVHRLSL